jgi:hypothetical protein
VNLYRIKLSGQFANYIYSYSKCSDILSLARFVNKRIENYPKERIFEIDLVENYDDKEGIRVFSQHEYNIQYFYETYEMRLIQHYREKNAV